MKPLPIVTTAEILAARPPKRTIPLDRPYAFYDEQERTASGTLESVSTLLLSNRECPFRCVMCDLWQSTLDDPAPRGAVASQVRHALAELPAAPHIKLYNAGNFFDEKAVSQSDRDEIARIVQSHKTVIVENHPKLCGDPCVSFANSIPGELEVAMGLETVHEPTLKWLNKNMTLDDFHRAAVRLRANGVQLRSFVLLRPPGMTREDGRDWAVRSVEFAIAQGVRVTAIVPVRAGNGIMERLADSGHFAPPTLSDLEETHRRCLELPAVQSGEARVFVDLWDLEKLASCNQCFAPRRERLQKMNETQQVTPPIDCDCDCNDGVNDGLSDGLAGGSERP